LAKECLKLALNSWDFSYLGPSISNFSSALGYAALSTGSEIADLISKNSPPAKIIEKPGLLSEASKAIEHFTDLFSHNTVEIIVVTEGPGYFDPRRSRNSGMLRLNGQIF
jgi:hypothetical protein